MNFFKWALEYDIINYIKDNYKNIEDDMNNNNSLSKSKKSYNTNTRKKREELSVSAIKCLKKEIVNITMNFNWFLIDFYLKMNWLYK